MIDIQTKPEGIVFKVYVQPRSAKNQISGVHDDALKLKIAAPPVDGAANKAVIQYLAKCLKIPKSSLEIVSGLSSRTKRILYRFHGEGLTQKLQDDVKSQVLSLTKSKHSA